MQEMGTQQLKHLVSKNIGKTQEDFLYQQQSSTYLLKDRVENLRDEVVEDTSQNNMKIRYMFAVKGKTTLSFIKVIDIKKYYDEYAILNIFESSTTSDLNYIG